MSDTGGGVVTKSPMDIVRERLGAAGDETTADAASRWVSRALAAEAERDAAVVNTEAVREVYGGEVTACNRHLEAIREALGVPPIEGEDGDGWLAIVLAKVADLTTRLAKAEEALAEAVEHYREGP